jgi:hypothetical protein
MRIALLALAACAAGCASTPLIPQPPPPWNSGPVPPHFTVSVPYFEVNAFCRNDVFGTRAEACVMPTAIGPMMVLPIAGRDGVTGQLVEQLRSHEEGHLRGWPKDHPG